MPKRKHPSLLPQEMKAEASAPYLSGTIAAKTVFGSLHAVDPGRCADPFSG